MSRISMKKILKAIDNLRNSIESLYHRQDSMIEEIRCIGKKLSENDNKELKNLKRKLQGTEEELTQKKNELSTQCEKFEAVKQELSDKKDNLEAANLELVTKQTQLAATQEELVATQEELSREKERNEVQLEELSHEKEKGEMQSVELSRIEGELSSTEVKLQEQTRMCEETVKNLRETENSLKAETETLISVQQQLSNYSSRFGDWEEITKDYRDIMDKMYRCPSLKGIVLKFALEEDFGKADTVSNMVKFIGVIGKGSSFAQEVYNALRAYKKTDLQYLTGEEKSFIAGLNRYYRKVLPVEFDVLDIPEGERFESAAMQDIDKPTAPYRNVAGVYVPGLREDQRTYRQKAIVQGERG